MRRRDFIKFLGGAAAWSLGAARVQLRSACPVEDYEQYRACLINLYYDNQLETLMSGFNRDRKTVILLPGGMGSQLQRTRRPHPAWPNVPDDVTWLDLGIAMGDGRMMEIDDAGKDDGAYVIAPRGPIKFFKARPYESLEILARHKRWNYGVFGFDWRRPLKESAANLKNFISGLRERAGERAISNLTIVCHSIGGLVATAALRDEDFNGLGFNAVVTIATPFYGTSTHQKRYFFGEESLNKLYGAKDVVRIVASLPGPYTLMFLPNEVFVRDRDKIGLTEYPQHDLGRDNVCDPFDGAMMPRWPKVVRDHWQYIQEAKGEMIDIAKSIHPNIAPKFFNVRSAVDNETAVEMIWKGIPGDTIDPQNGPNPLEGRSGPGDGTVPAWSAFHAYCEDQNCHELTEASDHPNLLRHPEVLALIENVVATGRLSAERTKLRRKRAAKPPAVATPQELDAAVTKWAAAPQTLPSEMLKAPVQRAFLDSLVGGTKPRMVGTSAFTLRRRTNR